MLLPSCQITECLSWLRPNGMWNHDNADRYPIYFPLLVFKCHSKSKVVTANYMLLEMAFSDCHPAFLRKLCGVVTQTALYVKECQDWMKDNRRPSHKAFRHCPGFLSPLESPLSSEIWYAVWGSPQPLLQTVIRGITNSLLLFDLLITRHLLTSLEDIQ